MRKNYKKIRGYLFASGVFAGVVLVSGASVLAITSCSKNNSKITIHDQLIANTFYKSDVGTPYSHEGFGTNPSTTHNCNPVEVSRIGDWNMITTTANDQKPTGSQIGQDMYSASQNVFFSYMSGGDDSIASCLVQDSNVSHTITCWATTDEAYFDDYDVSSWTQINLKIKFTLQDVSTSTLTITQPPAATVDVRSMTSLILSASNGFADWTRLILTSSDPSSATVVSNDNGSYVITGVGAGTTTVSLTYIGSTWKNVTLPTPSSWEIIVPIPPPGF